MIDRRPIFDNIDQEFGDLLAQLNAADRVGVDAVFGWVTAAVLACAMALAAGYAVAATIV
jgi:hypothetical protein